VRIPWGAAGAGGGAGVAGEAATPAASAPEADAREELRVAAAELARGAVGVARGVWDGVVERVSSARAGAEPPPAPATDDPEAPALRALEDSAAPDVGPALSGPDSPWRVELRKTRASAASAPASASSAATVPVPPRAEGGLAGSVLQSLLVGAEILGALVTGPVLVFARGAAARIDRSVRGFPAALGRGLRFVLFLLLMGVIGAVSAFVVLAAVALNA
jgi:hypothetical protein